MLRRFSHATKQTEDYFAGGYTVLDVALNPAVLRDGNVENREVCALALRFAQKHYGLSVCQDFTVIGCSPNSSPDEIYRRLRFRQRRIASEPVRGMEFNTLAEFCCCSEARTSRLSAVPDYLLHSESDPSRPSAADVLL